MADRKGLMLIILTILVVVMGAALLYFFVIAPTIQGYVVEKQTEGVQIAVNTILSQIQQYGYVQIPVGENQTLVLVPYTPQQQTQESA